MGWRFRKSISIGKIARLNIGKSGIGVSIGGKGMRVGMGSRGVYTSTGIPGTGLYNVSYAGKNKTTHHVGTSNKEMAQVEGCLVGCGLILLIGFGLIIYKFNKILGSSLVITGIGIICYKIFSKKERAIRTLGQAKIAYQSKNYNKAISLSEQTITLLPETLEAFYILAFSNYYKQDFQVAINYADKYLKYENEEDVRLLKANCFYQLKKYDEAIAISQSYPDNMDNYHQSLQTTALCFLGKEQPELAIETLKRAPLLKRDLTPELMDTHYILGAAYEKSGKKSLALKHYRKIYAKDIGFKDIAARITKIGSIEETNTSED